MVYSMVYVRCMYSVQYGVCMLYSTVYIRCIYGVKYGFDMVCVWCIYGVYTVYSMVYVCCIVLCIYGVYMVYSTVYIRCIYGVWYGVYMVYEWCMVWCIYGVCMVYVWCMVWFDLPLWRGGQEKWQLTPALRISYCCRQDGGRQNYIQFFQGQIINCSLLGLFQYCLEWELNSRPWIGRGLYTVTCFTTRPKEHFCQIT